jgi:hypothetical protein
MAKIKRERALAEYILVYRRIGKNIWGEESYVLNGFQTKICLPDR